MHTFPSFEENLTAFPRIEVAPGRFSYPNELATITTQHSFRTFFALGCLANETPPHRRRAGALSSTAKCEEVIHSLGTMARVLL